MSLLPCIALLRTSPGAVLEDYARLITLAAHADDLADTPIAVPSTAPDSLPGERPEPWQVDGVLRAIRGAPATESLTEIQHHPSLDPVLHVAQHWGVALERTRGPAGALYLCGLPAPGALSGLASRGMAPALTVVDAVTVCRRGAGGMPRLDIRGAIFASRDPVALDALLSRLRGLDPLRDIPTLAEAHERRLGCGDVGKAKLVGEISIAEERWWWSDHSQKTSRGLLQRLRGRHLEAARLVYEDWVFHTGWGSLYRGYQRRAISYAAR